MIICPKCGFQNEEGSLLAAFTAGRTPSQGTVKCLMCDTPIQVPAQYAHLFENRDLAEEVQLQAFRAARDEMEGEMEFRGCCLKVALIVICIVVFLCLSYWLATKYHFW